jgi:hypothetical protein
VNNGSQQQQQQQKKASFHLQFHFSMRAADKSRNFNSQMVNGW